MNGGKSQKPSMARDRSNSPSRMRGRSNSPSRMPGPSNIPSTDTRARGRSGSPSRMRGRSGSPSRMRGRSGSPSRMKGRSKSPSRVKGKSSSPSRRGGRSNSPSRARGRSNSPSRARGRSNSPSKMREKSNSPSRMRDRSASPSRRSKSPSEQKRGKLRKFRVLRKGKRRPGGDDGDDERTYKKKKRRLGNNMRRMAISESSCGCWKVMSYLVPIVLLLASAAGLILATGNAAKFTPNFIENLIPTLNNDELNDPFAGGDGTGARSWNNGDQSGLEMEFLNAVSPSWEVFFSLAILDWDYGNPDALTLTTTRIAPEKECKPEGGKVKVCDGDYGETKWRGINVSLYDDKGFVKASSARMNEYYLKNAGQDAKQYTMCHEIGHALGLGHTDEIFGNADLGNCLDYTDNFAVNKHPDVSNYEALLSIYGPAGGRRLRGKSIDTSRHLSQGLVDEMHGAVEKLLVRMDNNAHKDGWTLLHRTIHGEEHELELLEGYKVRVHMLLA